MTTTTPPPTEMKLTVSSVALTASVEFYADLDLGAKKYQRVFTFKTVAPITTGKQLQKTVDAEAQRWARSVKASPDDYKKYLCKP